MKSLFKNLKAIAILNKYPKCSLPRQNLNSGKSVAKLRQLQLGILSLIGVASVLVLPNSARAATTTLNFDDPAPTLVSGTALSQGAVYRFKNVTPGVDALVTIAQISNSKLTILDDNTAFATRFQPTIRHIGTSTTSYIRFDFQLVVSGTVTSTSVPNVYFSAQDVDGSGVANGVREFVEITNSQVSYVANPTLLSLNVAPLAGGIRYDQTNSSNVQPGIGTNDQYEFYSYLGTSVSNFSIIGGSSTGTNTTCNAINVGCDRQNSWTFNIADVQPLDFGDAPAGYGNASHAVPPAPTVYFGASVDGDDAPHYSPNADGDDLAGTDDEDGVASFPALTTTSTTYTVTASCKGTSIPVAAWIDFNRNGVFDAGERTTGTCNNTSVTLNWAGLSGLSAGTSYARLRIASNATEITNPSTLASDGEVEDYSLNITMSISGTVFSDADADVTINGSDAGTNAGSANLTIYAIDTAGKVLDKATVAANGTYTLAKITGSTSVTLRLSNDSTVAVGATAPTVSTIPSGWYYTGENKNGTVDGAIANLGNIALTTTTTNLTNENFGIRQAYTIAADTAPTTCNPDYRTALNTGVTAAGGQVATGANDLNWTAEWIAGPASGPGTPYAPPRPVGVMPAVVVGNLAPGAWVNEPGNARWISYPFRLPNNGNGVHNDADLDGITGEGNSSFSGPGTSDDVRLKFTSQLTLPSNANTVSISLPVGVAIDNQFVSIKVNGVENLVPTPAANPIAADYGSLKTVNITNGWQAGVNTIEVIVDSGPDRVGFLLGIQASSTQVCGKSNVVLVKRITAINGVSTINPSDNTTNLNQVLDNPATPNDDATVKWPPGYLVGAFNAGKIKPGDVLEYTVYFLNAKGANANTVKICDRIIGSQTYKTGSLEIRLGNASSSISLSDAADPALDRGQFYPSSASAPAACNLITPGSGVADNGTWAVDVMGTGSSAQPDFTTMPSATAPGTPTASYGFIRFKTIVNP